MSPAGQLAWIAEKFEQWTYPADSEGIPIDRDLLLTTVTLCWLTSTASSSAQREGSVRAGLVAALEPPVLASV